MTVPVLVGARDGILSGAMSRENVDALRAVYDQWERGNLRAGVDLYDRDVLFIPGQGWTDTGRYLGMDGITEFMRRYLDAWTNLTYAAEEMIEAENSVVVAVHQRGVGQGSGAPAEWRGFHVWTFRGRAVIRLEAFPDRGEALQAVGLTE
jgi:ketosteroid isomerase-like protein